MREAIVETRGVESAYQTVIKFEASGPRIHIFWRGDGDPDFHDHPGDFWTFPLISYVEAYLEADGRVGLRVVRAFRLHRRRAEFAHKVVGRWTGEMNGKFRVPMWEFQQPVVTLVWWGKKRREWGFHTTEGWVHWKEYVEKAEKRAAEAAQAPVG